MTFIMFESTNRWLWFAILKIIEKYIKTAPDNKYMNVMKKMKNFIVD